MANTGSPELVITDRKKAVDELKEFKANFKLGTESETPVLRKTSNGDVVPDQEKQELLQFHKSFNLCLGEPNQGQTPVQAPTTLALPGKGSSGFYKKRRRLKKPPKSKTFDDVYLLTSEVLGRGANSSVTTCRHRLSGREYAVKIVPKSSSGVRDKVLREIEILYHCRSNKNILHLIDSFEEEERFCLVFDKMAGGPLLAHIQKRERFTEREASLVVQEVACALAFLHDNGIAHRDLKPDNILCERENQIVPVCICDFDLSSMVIKGPQNTPATTPMLLTPVGSAEFMAPEVVETFLGDTFSYDKKCDLWSLGVTLYMMLCGHPPFNGNCGRNCGWEKGENCDRCKEMLLTRIQDGDYQFHEKDWSGISSEAKDLISRLLEKDVKRRLSAHQVLKHTWVAQEQPETPLQTPGVLSRHPSIPSELSHFAASCLEFTRQLSSQMVQEESDQLTELGHTYKASPDSGHSPSTRYTPITLSPPGSSDLAVRRKDEHIKIPKSNHDN